MSVVPVSVPHVCQMSEEPEDGMGCLEVRAPVSHRELSVLGTEPGFFVRALVTQSSL